MNEKLKGEIVGRSVVEWKKQLEQVEAQIEEGKERIKLYSMRSSLRGSAKEDRRLEQRKRGWIINGRSRKGAESTERECGQAEDLAR